MSETRKWKVGELARQTGLSVRALRFYDEIGLLRPSERTESGHRLYDEGDLSRLQRILSLRQLGFSLDEVRSCLDKPEYAVEPLLDLHLARLSEQMALYQRLHLRLTTIRTQLQTDDPVPASQMLAVLEAITMLDNYLTPAQVETVDKLHAQDGVTPGNDIRQQWQTLFQEITTHIGAADDPASAPVQALARRWQALIQESTRGDAELAKAAARMYREQPAARQRAGMSDAVWDYANKALAVLANGQAE